MPNDTSIDRVEKRIEQKGAQSLPGEERLVTPIRITCAQEDRMSSGLQQVGDHIRMAKLNPGRHRYETDRALQNNLIDFLRGHGTDDPEMPMRAPVYLTSDDIPHSLFRRLAMYRGTGQAVCACGAFTEKSPEKLQQQGITRAVGDSGIKGREYFEGIYTRQIFSETGQRVDVRTGRCDPAECPFMVGDRASAEDYRRVFHGTYGKYPKSDKVGQVLCKPQIKLTVAISEIADNMSPVAVLSSTSWNTGRQLNLILTKIKEATGGILCGLPLWLVLQFVQTQGPDGKTRTIPVWTIEPRGFAWNALPSKAAEIQQERLNAAQYHDDARSLMQDETHGLPAGRDFAREFHPEAVGEEGIEPREHLRWLLSEILEYSGSEISDVLDKLDTEADVKQALRHYSEVAEKRADGKAERLDIPGAEGEVAEDDPDGPPAIPCPDDISMFPTDRKEWADGLKACDWDAEALKSALAYTKHSKLPDIDDSTDPSSLWPVMVAINWYAGQVGLADPLQCIFDDIGADDLPDDVQEGEFEQMTLEDDEQ